MKKVYTGNKDFPIICKDTEIDGDWFVCKGLYRKEYLGMHSTGYYVETSDYHRIPYNTVTSITDTDAPLPTKEEALRIADEREMTRLKSDLYKYKEDYYSERKKRDNLEHKIKQLERDLSKCQLETISLEKQLEASKMIIEKLEESHETNKKLFRWW